MLVGAYGSDHLIQLPNQSGGREASSLLVCKEGERGHLKKLISNYVLKLQSHQF
jgi:hypothetical protein